MNAYKADGILIDRQSRNAFGFTQSKRYHLTVFRFHANVRINDGHQIQRAVNVNLNVLQEPCALQQSDVFGQYLSDVAIVAEVSHVDRRLTVTKSGVFNFVYLVTGLKNLKRKRDDENSELLASNRHMPSLPTIVDDFCERIINLCLSPPS